ncbi:MAG: alkylhydroperoxidase-related (seleno)protein [Acidimicrobiales bacterium]
MTMYEDAPVEVRSDLDDAHAATVAQWAQPGNHWTGAERLAMVTEVRQARAHASAPGETLPAWVGPTTVDADSHQHLPVSGGSLPANAIDAVWRLTNHPGTLTADWYQAILDEGMSPERYVELVAVVATANCIDVFATALGLPPRELPPPSPGEPDGVTVDDVAVRAHWVPTAPVRGANVGKALTSVPVAVVAWRRLSDAQYVPTDALLADLRWSRGSLDRLQVELLAARTSLLNECFY